MANVNYRALAMENLGMGLADLRNPDSRDAIIAEANKLQEENRSERSTFLRQSEIAKALATFPGFSESPEVYGPTVAEITDHLNLEREENDKVSRNRVVQHLAKMRNEDIIDSAPKLTSGKRGRPEVFFFLVDEPVFANVISGEYTAKG